MRKLSVPEHISLKKELVRGMGGKELLRWLAASAPAVAGVAVFWLFCDDPGSRLLALVGLLVYTGGGFVIFAVTEGNQSVYDFLAQWVRFMRSQKFYKYTQEKEDLFLYGQNETL